MTKTGSLPQPDKLYGDVFDACRGKVDLSLKTMVVIGVFAGVYIGLGGLFATVALAGANDLAFGAGQVLAGIVFSIGLALLLVAGAELCTGNTLMVGTVAARQIPAAKAFKALSVVYVANFAGSALFAGIVALSRSHEAGDGAVGRAAIDLPETKTAKGFATAMASGVLANLLVCLAVWIASAAHTAAGKIIGLVLPVTAFVGAGFEHSISNMYLRSCACTGHGRAKCDGGVARRRRCQSVACNVGNILGGAFAALTYHAACGKTARA